MIVVMRHICLVLCCLFWVLEVVPGQSGGWKLTWQDEFDGTSLDPSKWVYAEGGGGWGNNELQTYTSRSQNVAVENGHLVITALRENHTGTDAIAREYTSGRIRTQGKFSQTYGKFEARMKLPYGQGIWPAFWMLGDDIEQVGWPACGEIDIMENIGREPSTVHGTLHGPGYSGAKSIGGAHQLAGGKRFADDFHVFAVEWEPKEIRWYVDGKLFKTLKPTDLPAGSKWVFDHPHHMLLNLAVGGRWPGNPDTTTEFPQRLTVDYVRVYQRAGNQAR
jgi:beta-glucanase (GH16 family)